MLVYHYNVLFFDIKLLILAFLPSNHSGVSCKFPLIEDAVHCSTQREAGFLGWFYGEHVCEQFAFFKSKEPGYRCDPQLTELFIDFSECWLNPCGQSSL